MEDVHKNEKSEEKKRLKEDQVHARIVRFKTDLFDILVLEIIRLAKETEQQSEVG